MKTPRLLSPWTLALAGLAGLGACRAEQADPQCTVGRGDHAVRYTLKTKTGDGTCDQKKAEIVGAQAFRIPGAGIPPTVYFKPSALLPDKPATVVVASSSGPFTTEYPSADSVCTIPSMSEAHETVGGVDRRYTWSNVRVQSRAAIPGTQWVADVSYSEGGCTATYEAVGVFPAISCLNSTTNQPDSSLCKVAKPGVSLDPAFPVYCEETSKLCVLDGPPPATTSPETL